MYKKELYIKKYLGDNHNHPNKKLKTIKGEVIHGTANFHAGADALANRHFFNTTSSYCSSQYITDDNGILQILNDDDVAWHVGAKSYTKLGYSIMEGGYSPNHFLIGNEICVNKDGNFHKALEHAIINSVNLMHKYGYNENYIYRHHDITGKLCPSFMISDAEFDEYKRRAKHLYIQVYGEEPKVGDYPVIPEKMEVTTQTLNVRCGPGTEFTIIEVLHDGDIVETFELVNKYFHIGNDKWIHSSYVEEVNANLNDEIINGLVDEEDTRYKITSDYALIYEQPTTRSKVISRINKNELIDTNKIVRQWIETNKGYISLNDCAPLYVRSIIRIDPNKYDYFDESFNIIKDVRYIMFNKLLSFGDILKPILGKNTKLLVTKTFDEKPKIIYVKEKV